MTRAQLHVLLHTLGLTEPSVREPCRNCFVAGDDHDDMPDLRELVAAGLMEELRRPGFLPVGDRVFAATEAGRQVAESRRPRERLTRGQRRYGTWLQLRDACPDLSFRDFLTAPEWAGARTR